MKKYLPIAIFLLGLAVVGGVLFFVLKGKGNKPVDGEEDGVVTEIPFNQRPVTSLTPINSGHWLKLQVKDIKVKAATLDYELIYKTQDGGTQGVPGTVKLEGVTEIERELLMGSESSGKFRYDENVEEGTLTLRFRNDKGKLVGKLSTDFHLISGTNALTSLDDKFKFNATSGKGNVFLVMNTFGLPKQGVTVSEGPYGVFALEDASGEPEAGWTKVDYSQTTSLGIFYK